jgi:hypothetical protein
LLAVEEVQDEAWQANSLQSLEAGVAAERKDDDG